MVIRIPRVKAVHVPYRRDEQTIRIGGAYGVGVEIRDPDGLVWALIGAMDGTRTPTQVAHQVREWYPQHSVADLEDAVVQLLETGFFTDATAPVTVSESDRERYSRSIAYYSHIDRTPRRSEWEAQNRIEASHVTVLGVGGLGSACAYALAASGIGRLTLIDHDRVDLSNLARQVLYVHADVGRSKVEAAAERLTALRPDLPIDTRASAVADEADVVDVFAGCDLVVLAADTPVTIEEWANRSALKTGTAWVNGSYDGPHVSATLYVPGGGPCWRCMRLTHYTDDPFPANDHRVHMATAATANIAGNLTAHIALAHLTGIAAPPAGEPVVWNTVRLGHSFTSPVEPRPDCDECGGRR